jgi:hypothetical protein
MRKRTCKLGTAALLVAGFCIASAGADTISFIDTEYPSSAEVVTAPLADATFGDDANVSLTQTFSVPNAFSAAAIYLPYRSDTGGKLTDWTMTVRIYAVADVSATSLVAAGADVYTGTFTFPNVGQTDSIARIDLATNVLLNASVGTSGYAIEITEENGADFNPGWEWLRPTSEAYAGGVMYEDGVIKNSGARDLSLAISGIPDPVANDDEYILSAGSTSTNVAAPGVLANDVNYDSAALVTNISSGSLTFNADGSFSCSDLVNGLNTFSYAVVSGSLTTTPATVSLYVTLAEDPPTVVDDTFERDLGWGWTNLTGNVLDNDTNNSLVYEMYAMEDDYTVANGTLNVSTNGDFVYIPDVGFTGTNTFTYKAYTPLATSVVATVTLIVENIGPPGGELIDSFDTYDNSASVDLRDLVATNHWDPAGSGFADIIDGDGSNQYLELGWSGGYRGCYSLDALFSGIPTNTTEYWLYWEMYGTSVNVDGSFGLSANAVPNTKAITDFAAGVRMFNGGDTNLNLYAYTAVSTNGVLLSSIEQDTWYGIWLKINTAANTYDVYLGDAGDASNLGAQVGTNIAYAAADLTTLLATSINSIRIDNIINANIGTPYESWVADQGLTTGVNDALSDDPDADTMDNLLEYALGGNPLLNDAAVYLPGYELLADGGSNYLNYVYRRRIDYADRGMTYEVGAGGNLLYEPLTNATEYVNAGAIDAEFESVTNRISTDVESEQFMQLKVTID